MLTSITLQNFKSFGEEQTVPLRPITAIVGPNNSGKSNLVSLARFVRNVVDADMSTALQVEGGLTFTFHRPSVGDNTALLGWTTLYGRYFTRLTTPWAMQTSELLQDVEGHDAWQLEDKLLRPSPELQTVVQPRMASDPMSGLKMVMSLDHWDCGDYRRIVDPLISAREINLQLSALRQDAEVVPQPRLGSDGSGLAAVLGLWRGSDPDRAEQLHEFIRRCLPEVRHVFVKPSPEPSYQRLWIQQTDGQQFDAAHVSDGVLFFIALAMHAIEAEPGSVLFVEEPEQCIHPRRVGMIMELFRQVVAQRGCQVVVVTHSPILLNELRDEPESIVLFRRGDQGTRVKQLTEMPHLIDALRDAEPGEMLANGFFDAAF
jgi:predicted ATPase